MKELPHPNSYINQRNYFLIIIEYFVIKSSSASFIIKAQLLKALACLKGGVGALLFYLSSKS